MMIKKNYEKMYCDMMDDFDRMQDELRHIQTLALCKTKNHKHRKELALALSDAIGISYDLANSAISFQAEVIDDGMPND